MNKIFKVIWSKSKQCYIVVSEIAKNKTGKKKIVVASILAALTMTANIVTVEGAIPEGTRTDHLGLAIGTSSNSKSNQSIAIGYASSAQAPGANPENPATAVGAGANANGVGAVALGLSANATGANAVALGGGSNGGTNKTEATGTRATAISFNAKASGSDSIALGNATVASDEKAIAIGSDSKATDVGTTALGRSSAATGASATALGSLASATGTLATAVGMQASASGNESLAIGTTASATSGRSLAVGTNSKATGATAVAVGSGSGGSGPLGFAGSLNSTAGVVNTNRTVNYATTAEGDNAVALGFYANAKNSGVAVGQRALAATGGVAIGKGVLEDTGNNYAGGVVIGQDSATLGPYSLAMGFNAFASGSTSMAIGHTVSADGGFAVAMGRKVSASGTSTAIGHHATATNGGLAIGSQENDASNDRTTASAKGAVAIGKNTKATSEDAVAIGTNAQATRLNSVALGSGSTTATGATNQGSATINGITYNFAGATGNPNMQVSVGSTGATRQIKNVAAGEVSATSTDAINGSQLYAVASAVKPLKYVSINSTATGTGSNVDNDGAQAPNSIAIGPSSTVTKQNSIAFGNNAQSLSDDSITIGRNAKAEAGPAFTTTSRAIAIGANSKVATNVTQGIAIGSGSLTDEGAVVTGDQSIAIGGNVKVDGHAAVAIGGDDARKAAGQQVSYTNTNDNEVTGTLQTAIQNLTGYNLSNYKGTAASHAGVAYGTSALAGNAGVAIGTASDSMTRMNDKGQVVNNKPVTNAVAIGTGARANFDNSVAIGGGSNTDRYATKQVNAIIDGVEVKWSGGENISPGDVVSFGAKGFERQLKNVAPGEVSQTSTDAINGSQIYSLARKVTNIMNGGAGSLVNVNASGEPLTKVVTGTGTNKQEKYYRTVDVKDDGTLVTGAIAQTPKSLALVNVDEPNVNQQTQTPRTLGNVANGVNDNDAVNVSQLKAATVKYFSVNSTDAGNRDNTGATGTNAIAIGPAATATKAQSIALGNSATAGGTDSIAIGNGSVAADKVAPVAIGQGAQANGDFSVALGGGNWQFKGAQANGVGTTALGTYSKTAADTSYQTVVGFGANTTKANATAIGYNSAVSTEGGVALGANSSSSTGRTVGYNPNDGRTNTYSALTGNVIRSTTGAVAVGNGTEVTRQITGVAAGTNDTDAVNVAQLKSVNLAFVGDSGFGDVNLANNDTTKRFAVKGDSTYLTTRANGNLITVSANKKDISVTNGTATAATGMADAKNVAEAINKAVSQNAYTWNLTADNDTAGSRSTINKEGTVKFSGDKNITVARNGNTITSSLNKSIIVDSVKANNSVTTGSGSNQITLDGTTGAVTGNTFSGQSFTAGDNVLSNTTLQIGSPTNGNNVTITKDGLTSKAGTKTAKFGANGIDAGGQQITNVSSGGNVGTNAANITDVKNAVSDVTLKLDTNSKTGTVKLSESPLKVIGANGIRTDLVGTNNGSLVVGLDSNTVNATTKGIGLTGDTGSTGLKYLKDGDASFKVAGDGNLVTTKASATGVQVAVDTAKVKDLAVEAVTVSKANTSDNPITVTPTAGTNSKDYAIGIDTTKLAGKTDLTYRANNDTDANAQKVSLAKGLNFVNGDNTVATVAADGKVSYDLNAATKTKVDESATAVARNISLGADSGTASSQSLKDGDVAFNVKGATGDYVSTNMNGNTVEVSTKRATINSDANTGAASVTGNDGLATAKNVADAINKAADAAKAGSAWNLSANGDTSTKVSGGDTVEFTGDNNITVDRNNKTISTSLNKNLTDMNSISLVNPRGETIFLNGRDGSIQANKAEFKDNAGTSSTITSNQLKITNGLTDDNEHTTAIALGTISLKSGNNSSALDSKNLSFSDEDGNNAEGNAKGFTFQSAAGKQVEFGVDEIKAGGNKIQEVAEGTADTDAVNVKQLKDTVASQTLTYRANTAADADAKSVKLSKGLDFVDGTSTVATVDNDGKVSFDLNTATKTKIDDSATAVARNISLGADSGTASNQSLKDGDVAFNVKGATGDYVSTNMNGNTVEISTTRATINSDANNGAASVTGNDGLATAKNVADAINKAADAAKAGAAWNLTTNSSTTDKTSVQGGDTVDLINGDNILITQDGTDKKKITVATKKDLTVDSVTAGNTVINTSGLTNGTTAITGSGITTDKVTVGGISIDKTDGINAGGKAISNVASGGTTDTNAANIGDVKQAVANLSQNLNITDGTNNGTVDLKNQKLNVAGANGVTATVNNQTITVGLDADTVNATTKGIGLTADTASTGNKYLKDGDVSFAVTGDGNLVSTSATAAGVKVAVDAAKVKDLAVDAVTVSKDAQADNPITVTPTAGTNSKDYAIGIDTTKLAAKTDLTYRANNDTDANAKKVSLAKGLNFVNGTLTTASIDNDGVVKYDVNTAAITAGTDGTVTGPTTDGVATAQNVADAINAAKKASKTEITANTGEAANATTGNVTLTSTTAADGHTIYDVKLNDKVTLGTGANAVTIDGTAGKATVGTAVVDGVNNTITTGGANAVSLDGAAGTVTGLTNKDWTPGVTKAVTGRAATEDQLQKVADAASSQTWNITADKAGTTGAQTGTKKNATVGKDQTVELVAGDNLTINQDERKFTYSLNKDLAGLTSVSVGDGTTETINLDGATGKITAKNAVIGGVTVDGDNSHVTGLSNTTWNGTATTGRAATEDQLKAVADTAKATTDAVNLKFSGDTNTSAGVVNLKDDTFNIVGDGKYVTTDANGKDLTVKVSEAEVKKSAVAAVTVSTDTTDANNPISVTPTTSADGTTKDYKVTIDGTKIANKTNLSYKANDGTAKQVSLADGLNFKNGTLTTASIDDAGVVKYDVNTAAITAGTDGTVTGPTTDGVATAQNVADAINAAKKAAKTEITANTGEAANATTGNVTLTSTTATDGHTIYDVKLNDKVTLGTGANAVTIDGTAGTVTGLTNKDWTPGVTKAVTGRAATEDQLQKVADAASSQTWNITADKAGTTGAQTGTKKNATVGKDQTVELVAGDNLTINQDERKFTYSLNKDLAGLTSVSVGDGTTETINLDGATGKITAKNAVIGGVTVDGDNSHVTGLSNTTWNGTATTGRAATEDQLKAVADTAKATTDAVNLKFSGDTNTSAGVVNLKDDTFNIVGDGKYVTTDANGKDLTVKVSEAEVKKSAVAAVTVSTDTTDANNPISVTPTTSADGTTKDYKVTIDGTKIANKTNLSYKANDGTAKQVSLADGLNFKNGTLTTASIDDAGVVKYDVNTAAITAGTDGTVTGPTTDGVATAQNVADAINAAKKAAKTEITANTGEVANATTGNMTLTSTTAADGHTIYDVKLNDKVTLGTGANAVTIDGTAGKATVGTAVVDGVNNTITTGGANAVSLDGAAGKATIGSSVVDGVNNTITTGGANAVSLDGAAGTVTGLTNKDWTPGVTKAVTGRAATEDQLQKVADAASSQTWNITADKAGTTGAQTGTKKNATVGKDQTVELVAGDNLTINQDERKFTYSLNKDLAGLTSVSVGDGTTETINLDGATGKITAKNAVIGGVTVDGDNSHVTGLSNTTWNGTATTGRAATEDQLKAVADTAKATTDAVNLKFSGDTNTSAGVVNLKDDTFNIVGDGKYVTTDANGKDLTVKVSEAEVKKSAVAAVTVSTDTTDANNPISVTPTTSADGTTKDYKVTIDGTKIANKTNLSYKANDGTAKQVSLADGLNFKNGTLTTASIDDAGVVKYDVNTAAITAGTDGTVTGPTTDGVATAQNVADAINAAKKAAKTEITANTGEAANATTGNVTLTSTTAADGHTIYDVKLNDKVTLGTGANAVTIDGTAGKATVGTAVVDGVNNTITTGGANAVALDGAAGTVKTGTVTVTGGTTNDITGLSNTTVTAADFATKGRAATEEQLKAVGEQTWKITADKDATTSGAQTGTKKDAKVGKDDKVQLIAGENLTVNQNERDFTYSLNKDLVKMNSATFEATGGKTTVITGDSIAQTDGTKTTTSTAAGNTVADGGKSTATTADGTTVTNGADSTATTAAGTTVTSANGNTNYAADGVRINTTGKNPVSLTDAGLDNGNNVIKNVASGHVNNDDTDNTNAANIADVKKATTTVTANNGEAANATTGNVTLTSTTAADGHTIYDVKLNNKVTLGTGANAVTIDGTAGKATIGSSVVDGVNNTITTGGANAVALDGTAGTVKTGTVTVSGGTTNDITGLSNTTVNAADFATKGRAATEEQLKAVGEQTWQITADKDATTSGAQTGTKKDAKVGKDDKVQLIAGENLTVNQNERDFTYSLNKDLVKMNSATFEATGGKTTVITGDSIAQTDGTKTNTSTAAGNTVADGGKSTATTADGTTVTNGADSTATTAAGTTVTSANGNTNYAADGVRINTTGKNPVSLTDAGLDNGNNVIKNVASGHVNNDDTDNTNAANIADVKKATTTVTANNGEAANATTGNVTLTSTTAADGHTIYDVKLNDKVTLGTGANAVTIDGTAGKATVGTAVVDGVNNTITTGGANAVALDGAAGTVKTGTVTVTGGTTNDITGLSNTTVTAADFATKGRAATEEQLKAVGEQTWKITADKDATTSGAQTGTKKDAKVGKDDKVQLIAGENLTVNQNERDFTYSLNKNLVKMNSATFEATGGKTTVITGDSIAQTDGTKTNRSTAAGNTVADGTKSTETTAAGQVIKDGAKTNTSTVDENTLVDGAKSNKTTVDSNVIDDGNGNVNTSNATSNTIANGADSTATTAAGTTVTNANGNTNYAADGVRINTTGKNPVSLTDAGLDNGNNVIKNVASGHVNNDDTDNTNAANIADVKKATTTVTANNGEAANATTGNVTLTSTTAADGHTIYDVKLKDTVTLGTGTNAVTIDGTAGKVTAGSAVVDGVNNTITTGGANAVVLNGADGTVKTGTVTLTGGTTNDITGLSNTTVTAADFATKGRAATEEQLKAVGEQTWKITADKDATTSGAQTGTKKDAKVGKDDKVQLIAGENLTVNQNERDFTYSLNKDLVKMNSATFEATGGKTTVITGDSIAQTDGTKTNKSTAAGNTVADGTKSTETTAAGQVIKDGAKTNTSTVDENTLVDGAKSNKTTVDSNVIDDGNGNVNTSNATSNTIANGADSTATTAAGTTVTNANGNTNYAADGVRINTTGKNPVSLTDAGLDNGNNVIKNVASGHVNNDDTDNTNAANIADVKKATTTVTANNGEAANATTGNVTLTSTTAADGHTIYDVKLNDKVTLGTGANAVTIDGIAGKATVGTAVVDGVNNTITTGGANAVKLDGAAGTVKTGTVTVTGGTTNDITGLSNTTVNSADFATKGRAATEEQLKQVGEQTWQITADKDATTSGAQTGTKKDAKVGKDDKVQLIAGENLTVNQNERDFTYSLNKDLVKMNSATFEATGGKTTVITGDSIAQTDGTKTNTSTAAGNTVADGANSTATTAAGTTVTSANGNTNYAADGVRINTTGKNPVSLTDAGLDNGNNVIKNVASGHVNNDDTDNTNAANIADVKKATTTVTANNGEAANATTGNVTLTSTTAADGHTIYDVKLKDTVTLGTGTNAVTIDGTAGKVTAGSAVVDGVNNTITTGGANAVVLNGADGTVKTGTVTLTGGTTNDITGLSNTTVNSADFATKGRAATEEQLKQVGEQTWQITADKDTTTSGAQTGTKKDAKVGKDDKVQLIAGENLTVNQNERDFTYSLNKDLVKMNSATFEATGGKTTVITGDSIAQTDGTKTNRSTAASNTVADGTKSTETTAAGQVIKDGAKTNTSTVDENTLVDGAKSNKTTVDSNVIDDGNGNVNTSNATSNTITDGTNTSTITAGKAQIGTVGIDGVTSKITTGGANAVVLNGADGTVKTGTVTLTGGTTNDITGLSNTTVNSADFATKGRAATEEQLKQVGEQTWQITADKDATTSGAQTGTKKDAKVGKDDKVQLIAGENLTVNQNERDFTYSLNKDLVKMNSATFEATGGKTTVITGDSIAQTDGTKTNTSTAAGNIVVDGTKSTETTAAGQVIKDGAKTNTSTVGENTLVDGAKSNKSTVDSNVIDDGNGNVNTFNATSNTITDGTNTSTITAGKATIGSSIIDGVNNTFTTGGANAVKLDGAAGTVKTGTVTVTGGTTNDITGLSNTTVNSADFATKGRAATEEQLKQVGEQTWQITADKDATTSGNQTGTKKDAKVGKDDKVQLIAGENLTVNQNERDFTYSLNKDLVKMNSATFEATGGKTTVITGDSIAQTDGTKTNRSTAAGNTITDGTNTTEATASTVTVKDNAGNSTVITKDTITTGTGANKVTVDGTAGKVTAGSAVIDGVNNTITTGGANTVKLDGAAGTVTGLTNTAWTPGVTKAVSGRAATEDQLQQVSDAVGAGWNINSGTVAGSTGEANGSAKTKISSGEEVQLQAGNNLIIDQNGKTLAYSLNKNLKDMESAIFNATGGKTTVIKGDSIVQTDGGKTNTSNAAGNTVVDGTKSTATTAAGSTITDGAKTNTNTADKNVIDDGAGNTNTSNATSNTIADPNGNTNTATATSNTLADNAGNSNVSNATSNNLTDNAGNSNVSNATSNTLKNAAGDETKVDAKGATVKDAAGNTTNVASTGATVTNAAGDTTKVEATGTTVADAAGNKATFTKDGVTITKPGKDTVSLTGNGLDNGNNKIVNVADGTNDTDAVNVRQLDAKTKAATTELTANGGESANNTTGNIVLTKTTAPDGHIIYDNKLNDKITLGAADPTKAITVDGTNGTIKAGKDGNAVAINGTDGTIKAGDGTNAVAIDGVNGSVKVADKIALNGKDGKAAIGTVGIDGKDGIITTGGNNPVAVNGKDGVVTGLTNKTWDPNNITSGRAATEDQVQSAVANAGWDATVGTEGSGVNSTPSATPEKIRPNETLTFKAGNNMMVSHAGKTISYAINPELTDMKSATFKDAAGNTTVTNGNGITITPGSANPNNPNAGPVSLTKDGLNNGNNQIKGVAPGSDDTDAVNIGQLKASNAKMGDAIGQVAGEVQRVGAHAAAMAALKPIQYDPLEPTQIMAGVGNYRGETAAALGLAHYTNEDTMFNVGVSVGGNHNMVNAGVTHKFGSSPEKKNIPDRYKAGPISSVYVMQDEVSSLKKENAEQKYVIADQAARLNTLEAENERQRQELAETKQGLDDLRAAVDKLLASKG